MPVLRVHYPELPLVVENTGHVVEVPQSGNGERGTLVAGDDEYELVQWHVHAPSEHVLGRHRYDLEIHLVHRDARDRVAVVAVLADTAPRRGSADRSVRTHSAARLLARALGSAPATVGSEVDTGLEASALRLLPPPAGRGADESETIRHYLTYSGSLTTPPCTEGVRWFVLTRTTQVHAGTVAELRELIEGFPGYDGYGANARPLQDGDGRKVLRRVS